MIELGYPLISEAPVMQGFGANEAVYKKFGQLGHNGVDLGTIEGMPVLAMADGDVRFSGDGIRESLMGRAAGCCVLLVHKSYPAIGGYMTGYAHLSRIYVYLGDRVKKGDVIGLSGKSGATNGPHLHIEYMPAPLDITNGYMGRAPLTVVGTAISVGVSGGDDE